MQEKSKLGNEDLAHDFSEFSVRCLIQWIKYYQKNKPQTNALASGIMLVVYGGQQLGWGIFNNHMQAQPWAGGYEDEGTIFWAIVCWFIASIIGFFVASFVERKFSKFLIYVSFTCPVHYKQIINMFFRLFVQLFRESVPLCSFTDQKVFITFFRLEFLLDSPMESSTQLC